MAGAEGIEPSSTVLETAVLPLNHAPRALYGATGIINFPYTAGKGLFIADARLCFPALLP